MWNSLVVSTLKISQKVPQIKVKPTQLQYWQLLRLLSAAMYTDFGKRYKFKRIIQQGIYHPERLFEQFASQVPIHTYETIHSEWWKRQQEGESSVTWPGKIFYYAMSSGTSDASSKYLPLSKSMLSSNKKAGVSVIKSLVHFPISKKCLGKDILILSGSTTLSEQSDYAAGDLSGIQSSMMPLWFQPWVKPGMDIRALNDWNDKMELIVQQAPSWDIGFIVGVPSWFQLLFQKIIERYNLTTIHDIWPNLEVFVHGGVSMDTYRNSFDKQFSKPVQYIETYLASEGFIALQRTPQDKGMRLLLNQGIYYEFVPFTSEYFNADGEIICTQGIKNITQVELGIEYALLLTTNSGAWRYIIGDTIEFINLRTNEIRITGRVKHFISLCGEHTGIDNFNQTIDFLYHNFGLSVQEFTVVGRVEGKRMWHHWYLGLDENSTARTTLQELASNMDTYMCSINDDYRTERSSNVLLPLDVTVLPKETFYQWMEQEGKLGGQHKFPRVLKGKSLQSWNTFLQSSK
ncbi:MAG: GH3 auxin-responsive promoter family protein [Cytophagaceae bacterium]|jgi:hypothetical protein|nr:GH3 auxin-responsive promoter family protein [Cytophagaceae bacterium]